MLRSMNEIAPFVLNSACFGEYRIPGISVRNQQGDIVIQRIQRDSYNQIGLSAVTQLSVTRFSDTLSGVDVAPVDRHFVGAWFICFRVKNARISRTADSPSIRHPTLGLLVYCGA